MAVTEVHYQADSTESGSSFQPDPGEALIDEARQRARTRRKRFTWVGILVSIAAVAAITATVAVSGSGSSTAGRPVVDAAADAGAPFAEPSVGDAALVASWGGFHAGWVLVYDDGRVIWYPDAGAGMAEGMSRYAIVERRLTPEGLGLVQSGALSPGKFNRSALVPADVWAEAQWRPYVPAEYAVCHWEQDGLTGRWVAASTVLAELPPAARTLLRDSQRQYTGFAFNFETPERQAAVECFALTTDEADSLVEVSYRPDVRRYRAEGAGLRFVGERLVVGMQIMPVMPHGEFVLWGG